MDPIHLFFKKGGKKDPALLAAFVFVPDCLAD